jgi:hypothetical protein
MGMHDRCKNKRLDRHTYKKITVCERWNKFENFFEDMGNPPTNKHSIDRIDNDGNYCPENCRWATYTEQARNKSNNTILEYDGKRMTIAEWSEYNGIKAATICRRIYVQRWPLSEALTREPIKKLPEIKPWVEARMSRTTWYRRKKNGQI